MLFILIIALAAAAPLIDAQKCDEWEYYDGYNAKGRASHYVKGARTQKQCRDTCLHVPIAAGERSCGGYSFHRTHRWCYLYESVTPSQLYRYVVYDTLIRKCVECNEWEKTANHHVSGGKLEPEAKTELICKNLCMSRPMKGSGSCDRVDFDRNSQACYTHSDSSAKTSKPLSGVDTFKRKCPSSYCNLWDRFEGSKITGFTAKSFVEGARTETDCRETCEHVPITGGERSCDGFLWEMGKDRCYILRGTNAGQRVADDTYVSMKRKCLA